MAIGRISGSVLKANLTRNGTDLAFETNLLYLDVTNSRVGIGTSEPATALHVNGDITVGTNNKLRLRDSGTYINSNADGDLDIVSDGTNNDAIKITSAGGVNIDANNTSATGVINLDANYHGYVGLKDNGTTYGTFTNLNTSNFYITSSISDADIVFRGNDGGSTISPLSIDMSAGGIIGIGTVDASYTALNTLTVNTGSDIPLYIHSTDANNYTVMSDTSGSIKFGTASGGFSVNVGGDAGGGTKPSSTSHYANGASEKFAVSSAGVVTISGAYSLPTADGSNGQVLQTDGSGALTFAESSGGGGGNNTAVKQFNHFKLGTTQTAVDTFDKGEFRGALYTIIMEDKTSGFMGSAKVSVVHDGTTPYVSMYDLNEDSTRIADFTAQISGDEVQLLGTANTSSHVNLRIYRVALGDTHETVANTNSKIIKSSTNIGSTATTIDQFTKTDIYGARYFIVIQDTTGGDYQVSEVNITHNGTTPFLTTTGVVSSRATATHDFTASISGSTVNLFCTSTGNTTATAILYRVDLGPKTKLGHYDNTNFSFKSDVDSAIETIDTFDAHKFKSAKYFINIGSGSEYQNSEINLVVNSAGTDAFITEQFVITGNNILATFSADVSSGKVRLRASCNPNSALYVSRMAIEADNIYRATGQTSDDLYITHNNLKLEPGALTLPTGTTANRPSSSAVGMIRYNTDTGSYERYDSAGWVNIAKTATATEASGTTTGEATSISTSAVNVDTFDRSSFDSVFYQMVTRDEINDEIGTQAVSLVHNDTDAFVGTGGIVRSGSNTQVAFDADLSGSTVRLRGTGTADVNSVKFFRIGLGDNTSASSSGNTAFILNTDVDSAVENLDTWSASSYRGAKYYISANNASKTELNNIECMVVHNGSDAFITIYNDVATGDNPLVSLSADISGGNVRLRASGNEPNTAVKMYRVLLGDAESDATSDNTKTVGQVTVSSSATEFDTFSTDSYNGAHYVIVGNSSSESAASISEVFVVTDGTDAYVVTGPQVSSKLTDQLTFTAALSGSTVTLSAASTSGASTTVNGYRVQLLRNPAGASTSLSVLTTNTQTISGAKTFSSGVAITNTSTSDALTITTTEDSSTAAPQITLKRNSSSPADADYLGQITFKGENDADQAINYAKITGKILDASDGSEDGILEFAFQKNGSNNISGRFRSDSLQLLNDTSLRVTGHGEFGVLASDPGGSAGYAKIYAKDESASAEMFVQDEAGNVTKISPHNEKGEWEYFSRNTKTGKTVRVNMEEMIRDIEKLTGKKYIKND